MKKRVYLAVMAMVMMMECFAGCGNKTKDPVTNPPIETMNPGQQNPEQNNQNPDGQKTEPEKKMSVVEKFIKEHPDYNGEDKKGILSFFSNSSASRGQSYSSAPAMVECEEACYDVAVPSDGYYEYENPFNTEEYSAITVNGFSKVALSPLSTFSADVDTASYSNVRRFFNSGYAPSEIPKGSVRTEEMVNYFTYNYNYPKAGEPFGVTTQISKCPWNENSKLLTVGLQTEKIDFSQSPDSNIVFLIDVSGSMYDENKLPLLVDSFILMLQELGEKDRVSIVTYAGEDRVVLKGVPASEKETIEEALRGLSAGGGTNGGRGIISAYKLAEENFIEGGNNRVILATDGDLNIGVTNTSDLKDLIKEESETGVFLTILGFGMGNYSDTNLETMADSGNGNYAYIDDIKEAKKVLCDQLGATMVTAAKDVKLQVEFNPAVVSEYRLIGYEDRTLAAEDFKDDTKDAGEIGAGHSVTAIYEIVTVDQKKNEEEGLKYQETKLTDEALSSDEWLTLSIRYKEPSEDTSKLLEYPIGNSSYTETPSDDFVFASAVAEFAQILRGEEFVGDAKVSDIYDVISKMELKDDYREDFFQMVKQAMANE